MKKGRKEEGHHPTDQVIFDGDGDDDDTGQLKHALLKLKTNQPINQPTTTAEEKIMNKPKENRIM